MNTSRLIPLSQIRIDGGTQPREAIDPTTVDEYAEAMRGLASFPPAVVFHDGVDTWLADGFHRYHAELKIEAQTLEVDWRIGTLEMAILYAASANAKHGLRRTLGDKRRAIEMVLSTEQGKRWNQQEIAKHCNVARSWVAEVMAKCRTDNPPKNPPPAQVTKTERKRAHVAAAIAAAPAASDRAIGRQLGVDRQTVAAVRARAKAQRDQPGAVGGRATPPAPTGGYLTAEGYESTRAKVDVARGWRAALTDGDWKAFLAEIGELE